jgi:CubicO group peptidase (beta-lactamase class C family)
MFRIFLIAAAAVLCAFDGPDQSTVPDAPPPAGVAGADAADLLRALDQAAPGWLRDHDVPSAAVAYIADGEIAWTAVYGEQSPGVPASADTLYNIASLTKPITAEAILRLAAAGEIALDESMANHWIDPDLVGDPRHRLLTPELALSHRTGFASNWRYQTEGVLRIGDVPGTRSRYSGEGYNYVARFAEAKLGRPFEELVREWVFEPAGMTRTAFTPQPWFQDHVAMVQGPDGSRRLPDTSESWSAADNVHTTIGDYARFVLGAMNREGLDPATAQARRRIAENLAAQACPPERIAPELCPDRVGFGLGWQLFDNGEETVLMHTGGDWGERALAFFVLDRQLGVVVLTSGANGLKVIRDAVALLYANRELNALIAAQAGD